MVWVQASCTFITGRNSGVLPVLLLHYDSQVPCLASGVILLSLDRTNVLNAPRDVNVSVSGGHCAANGALWQCTPFF